MGFKEYVVNILYICIFAIVLELFLPKTKLKKYISSIISLLILMAIVTPIFNVFTNTNIEKAIDDTIYALSNNADITSKTNSFDFSKYTNKVIVSRVKMNLEQQMLQEFSNNLKDIATISNVEVLLDDKYTIQEVVVYVKETNDLNTVKIILDKIIFEYDIPGTMLKIIEKGE